MLYNYLNDKLLFYRGVILGYENFNITYFLFSKSYAQQDEKPCDKNYEPIPPDKIKFFKDMVKKNKCCGDKVETTLIEENNPIETVNGQKVLRIIF